MSGRALVLMLPRTGVNPDRRACSGFLRGVDGFSATIGWGGRGSAGSKSSGARRFFPIDVLEIDGDNTDMCGPGIDMGDVLTSSGVIACMTAKGFLFDSGVAGLGI